MSWKKNLAITTALATATLGTIHVINKLIYFSSTLDNKLHNPNASYYDWKFGKIYYTKQGEGKPILLIHDLSTCSSSYEWTNITEKLAETNTVYCIDLLGCGRSDKPNITYTNYLYVQLISDFIRQIIGDKTDVIATGESGSFVLAACQTDDSIIDQIMLVNPSDTNMLTKAPTKRTKMLSLLINAPIIGTFLYNLLTRREDIEAYFQGDYFYNSHNITIDLIDTYYETAHIGNAASKHLFASLAGHYTTINIRHCLGGLNNSIFILTGEGNPNFREHAEKYAEILPSIEIADIEDTKYLPQLEKPESFIEQVKILLSI